MSRYLCLDMGEKRIGVAMSDPLGVSAQPRPYLPNTDQLVPTLIDMIQDEDVHTLVLGLPKDRDGNDSPKAKEIKAFAEQLEQRFFEYELQCAIIFQDERFSTHAANRVLLQADLSRKRRKEVIDSTAAVFILQGVLDRHN